MNLERMSRAGFEHVVENAGLALSEDQIRGIAEAEDSCLSDACRISFGERAASRIVCEFSTSPYIYNDGVFEVLVELTEAFYGLRDEFPASVTDFEIIELLRASYDGEAAGDVSLAATLTRESLMLSSNDKVYEIADTEGNVYRWDPEEWQDDVMADGWYGERWEDADE